MPQDSRVSEAVVTSYTEERFSPDQQVQRCVAAFWEFNRELFEAHFCYVADDRKGPALDKLFLDVLRSIRPLEKASKTKRMENAVERPKGTA